MPAVGSSDTIQKTRETAWQRTCAAGKSDLWIQSWRLCESGYGQQKKGCRRTSFKTSRDDRQMLRILNSHGPSKTESLWLSCSGDIKPVFGARACMRGASTHSMRPVAGRARAQSQLSSNRINLNPAATSHFIAKLRRQNTARRTGKDDGRCQEKGFGPTAKALK